jgi:hypothetical protein
MTGDRTVTWDGLSLTVPPGWEPARLGLGYLMLEDASGPRLTLRWQRLKRPQEPSRVLKRLASRKLLRPTGKPESKLRGVLSAWLDALPEAWQALPCSDASGHGTDAVLFVIPGENLAILAAPHLRPCEETSFDCATGEFVAVAPEPHPGEATALWSRVAGSVSPAAPGDFSLYDVLGRAPAGFNLTAFTVQLGHFHFQYQSHNGVLDYYRFAPSEVILRGKALDDWAGSVFVQTLGKTRRFEAAYFGGFPAVEFRSFRAGDGDSIARSGSLHAGRLTQAVRDLAARMFASARFIRAMAWRPDQSRIFAVVARHAGDLSPEAFEEVCRRYVVQAP